MVLWSEFAGSSISLMLSGREVKTGVGGVPVFHERVAEKSAGIPESRVVSIWRSCLQDGRELLTENEVYLKNNAILYDSQKLRKYAEQQREDRDNMDETNWIRQRKIMRQQQFKNKSQQDTE